ncbi:nucleoside-diphosphate sugar epimerase/dehydratase [Nordella sp. HKS 07]|uniref:polysaccharide biosynthesis protein n=1 Tax=Nordella sp. HKS 07 TaxID=2712222 RepID=UPI001FEF94F9|nr:nucleoside-diphosphate sugar epimerase/dehydratase [Nordella sp. HKS 07]
MVKAPSRYLTLYLTDLSLCVLALVLAMIFRFSLDAPFSVHQEFNRLPAAVLMLVVICAVIFPATGLYDRNWRFASISDLMSIVNAGIFSSLTFVFALFLFNRVESIPRSVVAIEMLLLIPLLAFVRLRFRLDELRPLGPYYSGTDVRKEAVPILLVGAGHAADLYLRALRHDPNARYRPVGFIEDMPTQQGLMLRGIPVLGTLGEFDRVLELLSARGQRPRHVIFTEPLSAFTEGSAQALVDRAEKLGIAYSRLNPVTELRNPRSQDRFEVRPIEMTDLLERPQAALDKEAVHRLISGRKVLITGAGGSIGSELTQQIAALRPAELILIENCEYNLYAIDMALAEAHGSIKRTAHMCDVRDASRLEKIFSLHQPELVFHAAALKHVPMVELNPCEGMLTNVIGSMNVANMAKRVGALAMVQVSTDKVVNSTSVMGISKRLAELFCQALDLDGLAANTSPRFMTVRFGNVLGSSGSLIPLFKRQIARGGPLTVTHPDMTRYFMTIREAVELTLQASAYGLERKLGQGEVFVLDMGEPVKIIDIARRMIRLAGYTPDKDIRIEFVGCRPGEKLFEELFDDSEKRVASPVPGVLGAIPNPVPSQLLRENFSRLAACAQRGDVDGMFEIIGEVLPNNARVASATSRKAGISESNAGFNLGGPCAATR